MSKSRYRSKLLVEEEEKPQHIIEAKEQNSKNNLTIVKPFTERFKSFLFSTSSFLLANKPQQEAYSCKI